MSETPIADEVAEAIDDLTPQTSTQKDVSIRIDPKIAG